MVKDGGWGVCVKVQLPGYTPYQYHCNNSSNGGNDHFEPLEPLFIGFLPGGSTGPFPLNTVKTVSPCSCVGSLVSVHCVPNV